MVRADGTIAARTVRSWDTVRTYRFEYEDKKVIRESQSESTVITYENDDKGRITQKINTNRMWTEFVTKTWYEYDEWGNVTGIRELTGKATSPSYQKYLYDDDDRMVKEEYYLGNVKLISDTFYEYETVEKTQGT